MRESFKPGDIVAYRDPDQSDPMYRLITDTSSYEGGPTTYEWESLDTPGVKFYTAGTWDPHMTEWPWKPILRDARRLWTSERERFGK
jgi:hypothetical protein